MDLIVHSVERIPESAHWRGNVSAHSREQMEGAPVATIWLQVRFAPCCDTPMTNRHLQEQARDEALRFLDIA